MYNKVDTIIAKARYTLSLPINRNIINYRNRGGGGEGGGGERKGTPFLPAKRIRLWTMALDYVFAQPQSV